MLAMDPRIPDQDEYFEFAINSVPGLMEVRWYINDKFVGSAAKPTFAWPLSKGAHRTRAEVYLRGHVAPVLTDEIDYTVN
jgi:penicillin-binding protein 1C